VTDSTLTQVKGWLNDKIWEEYLNGFILNITPVHNEDLIVSVLTKTELVTLYRFYGVRHSQLQLGYKIDFEIENSSGSMMPRLRNVLHLGFAWLYELKHLMVWQQFSTLLYNHLRSNDAELDPIYYNLLDKSASIFHKQNPKRVIIETYVQLLEAEGRLHTENRCFICDQPIYEEISLARAYLPAHPNCINSTVYNISLINKLFLEKTTVFIDDKDIEPLYTLILEGV